jgi:hypothetical protein
MLEAIGIRDAAAGLAALERIRSSSRRAPRTSAAARGHTEAPRTAVAKAVTIRS